MNYRITLKTNEIHFLPNKQIDYVNKLVMKITKKENRVNKEAEKKLNIYE